MHPRFTTSPCMKSRDVNSILRAGIPSSSGRTVDSSIHNSGTRVRPYPGSFSRSASDLLHSFAEFLKSLGQRHFL
jgi:hypothetical protein